MTMHEIEKYLEVVNDELDWIGVKGVALRKIFVLENFLSSV